jgi:hypothetical protein
MRSLLVIFAILLLLLTLISSLGGSLSAKEQFFVEEEPEMEEFNEGEDASVMPPTGPTQEETTETYVDGEAEVEGEEGEAIEPFESQDSMHASF